MRRLKTRIPFRAKPNLATMVREPFHRDGWVYEEKYDGDRILAYKEGGHVSLLSRNAKDRTSDFPRIAAAILNLQPGTLLLDGEVVVFDKKGVSRFQLLNNREGSPFMRFLIASIKMAKTCDASRCPCAALP